LVGSVDARTEKRSRNKVKAIMTTPGIQHGSRDFSSKIVFIHEKGDIYNIYREGRNKTGWNGCD